MARLESFKGPKTLHFEDNLTLKFKDPKLSNLEIFRALKLSKLDSFRVLKLS